MLTLTLKGRPVPAAMVATMVVVAAVGVLQAGSVPDNAQATPPATAPTQTRR
jgi:hypothetical protein